MASLPTAYASQRFGRKTLDFYAAGGEVIGADPRARADERRLEDMEGARHTVRLMDSSFVLEPGDQASVLRMQPGPNRRSRPVAVINHSRGTWARTHPGASGILAKAGVGRSVNFALTLVLFALAALAAVWPFLQAFLVEIDPAMFSQMPGFDLFALLGGALPALAETRLQDLIAPLAAPISEVVPFLSGWEASLAYLSAAMLGGLLVLWGRSWRLVWAPLYVVALMTGAATVSGIEGAVVTALGGLGLATGLFLIVGLINSIRDSARFERRIAVLADHISSHAEEETVAAFAQEADDVVGIVAPVQTAASFREPTSGDDEMGAVESPAEPEPDPSDEPADLLEAETAQVEAATEELETLEPEAGPEEELATMDATASEVDSEAPGDGDPHGDDTPTPGVAHPVDPTDAANQLDVSDGEAPLAEAEGAEFETDAADAATEVEENSEAGPVEVEAEGESAAEGDAHPIEAQTDESHGAAGQDDASAGSEAEPPQGEADQDQDRPAGFEAEEQERLKTDPRYAARAIVLPPPPPMPTDASAQGGEASAATEPDSAVRSETRTLRPTAALPPNVVPIFGGPRSKSTDENA